MSSEEDINFLQCAQDPLAGWDEFIAGKRREELATAKLAEAAVFNKRKTRKRSKKDQVSFVVSKAQRKGYRILKIQISDFDERQNSYTESVRVQYVVTEQMDDIMDSAQNIINKISKRLYDE